MVIGYTVAGSYIIYNDNYSLRRLVNTMVHEMFHALGVFYDYDDAIYVDPSDGSSKLADYFKVENGVRYFSGPKTLEYYNERVGCDA